MDREEFKKKYLTDAFYFVENKDDFVMLQTIGIWFGFKNPIGDTSLIAYDLYDVSKAIAPKPGTRVAENLVFFPNGIFQITDFWVDGASYGEPKSVKECVEAYDALTTTSEQ